MRAGNLTGSPTPIYDPLTGNADGTGRVPFAGNIITPNRIDSGVQNLLGRPEWSLPNQLGTGSLGLARNLLTDGNTYLRRGQTDGKISWNPTEKFSMFVRLGWGNNYWTTPQQFGVLGGPNMSLTNTAAGQGATNVFNGTISGTYILSPRLVFDAHFGYSINIAYSKQPAQDQNLGWTLLQIPGLNTSSLSRERALNEGGMPSIVIDGFANLGSQTRFQPQQYYDPQRNMNANLSWIKGNHNLRFGFDSDFQASNATQYQPPSGNFITGAGGFHFTQGTTQLRGGPAGNDYNAFASFLLGLSADSGKVYHFPDILRSRSKWLALYARDQWQVTPKLTVNAGVRADYFPFPTRAGTGIEYYDDSTNNMVICGVGAIPLDCGIDKSKLRLVPRLGVAYRLGRSVVIRAGYGMATDPINLFGLARLNFPNILGQVLISPNAFSYATTLRQGIPILVVPDLSTGKVPVPGYAGLGDFDRANFKRGYNATYNFTIEGRVREDWTASVAYAGSTQISPQTSLEKNWSPIGTGTAWLLLNTPGRNGQAINDGRIASTPLLGVMGTSRYDSLQGSTRARFSGVTLTAGYTFSKNLGFTNPSGLRGGAAMPWLYRSFNYGTLAGDITHNFQLTTVAELPFGKGKRWVSSGMAARILGGWQLSSLFSAYGGRPFTAVAAQPTLNAIGSFQRADCLSKPQQTGDILRWYDPSAFKAPASGRFGTCGQNVLRGPGLINVDAGIEKKFRFGERWTFSFRGEMFNVANTPHHASPGFSDSTSTNANNSINSSAFMQALNIANVGRDGLDERTIRFSLKLSF